jgi:hypothetical protein
MEVKSFIYLKKSSMSRRATINSRRNHNDRKDMQHLFQRPKKLSGIRPLLTEEELQELYKWRKENGL